MKQTPTPFATLVPGFTLPGAEPNGVQLGGLGTGRVELGAGGRITMAGITNNWQRLLAGLEGAFFSLHVQGAGSSQFHMLQADALEGQPGMAVTYHGLHPVAQVQYRAATCPVAVDLTAFTPLVPHDVTASTLPGAVFAFRLHNPTAGAVTLKLGFSWEHLLGCGGTGQRGMALQTNRTGNVIEPWTSPHGHGLGLLFTGGNPAQLPNTRGEMVLAVAAPAARVWAYNMWNVLADRPAVLTALAEGQEPERFDAGAHAEVTACAAAKAAKPPSWDDPDPRFSGARTGLEGAVHPAGILGVELTLEPGASAEIPFVLAWHTPTHITSAAPAHDHGHFYTRHFNSAGAVAEHLLTNWPRHLTETRALAEFVTQSDLPTWLAEKLINDNTVQSSNTIVTRGGDLYTLEASPMMFGALGTLDQRLVSHPAFSLFYPELNRTELRTFARLQAPDGSLPHFNGNAHVALGSAAVEYGVTGWPDLACSFIIQCYRDWTETGDSAFYQEMLPSLWRAADWLLAADQDGDGVPEGGSSWDIEHYPGCFIATATLWLGTLRVLEACARRGTETARLPVLSAALAKASATVAGMWNGTSYLKNFDSRTGAKSDDVFLGQLAGEWVVRQLGLAPVLPPEHVATVLATIYRLHGDRTRYPLMPIQVQPDGTLPDRKYAWHAWPQYGLVFVDCLALHTGAEPAALASLAAFDHVVREVNQTPWATTLWHDARTGEPDFGSFIGRDWYMNTAASWFALSALTGFTADEPAATVTMGPYLAPGQTTARYPVITPRYWAYLTITRTAAGRTVTLTPVRIFRGNSVRVQTIRWRGTLGTVRHGEQVCRLEPVGPYTDIHLPGVETLQAGETLTVTLG